MANEIAIKKMMDACDQDPKLQARLFHDPKVVAKEYGAELSSDEVQQLKRVGALMSLVDEFKAGRVGVGPGPIYYPIDTWWKQTVFNHVISYRSLYNPLFNPIFYPIGYVFNVGAQEFGGQFAALRMRRR
ncbi:MAG TPA: hypothetical protein VL523_07360 [Terriglobia bacterium]|nr:hypothetical protein [Terriglobia bacterium]